MYHCIRLYASYVSIIIVPVNLGFVKGAFRDVDGSVAKPRVLNESPVDSQTPR